MDEYYDAYDDVGIDGLARSPQLLQITEESRIWRIRQVLADPDGNHDWAIEAELDVEATDEAGEPVLAITHRSEEHTSELQSRCHLVRPLLLGRKKMCIDL